MTCKTCGGTALIHDATAQEGRSYLTTVDCPACKGGKDDEMNAAYENLRSCQRQLDMDGCHVGVSRQALEEVLDDYARLRSEVARLTEERDDTNEALTIAYMQGAASVRERAEAAEARAQSAEAALAKLLEWSDRLAEQLRDLERIPDAAERRRAEKLISEYDAFRALIETENDDGV